MNTPWITILLLALSPLPTFASNCVCKSAAGPTGEYQVSEQRNCLPRARGEICEFKRSYNTSYFFTPDPENSRSFKMAKQFCQEDCYKFYKFNPLRLPYCFAVCSAEITQARNSGK